MVVTWSALLSAFIFSLIAETMQIFFCCIFCIFYFCHLHGVVAQVQVHVSRVPSGEERGKSSGAITKQKRLQGLFTPGTYSLE